MRKTKIYLAHALTGAPEVFISLMDILRNQLERTIPNVEVLRFNWVIGKGPDTSKIPNTYIHDIDHVKNTDLVVAILDYPSIGLGMEIQQRCSLGLPMRCFIDPVRRLSQIVPDCIKHWRQVSDNAFDIMDPIEYGSINEIVANVGQWCGAETVCRDTERTHIDALAQVATFAAVVG